MRGFILNDAFKLSEIIDVMGIELDLNELLDKAQEDKKIKERVGAQIVLLFLKKIHKAQTQIIEFIAEICGEDIETVKQYKPKQIKDFFTNLFKSEDFIDFFTSGRA